MNRTKNTINCPHCGNEIDVSEILYQELDDRAKKKYADQMANEKEKFKQQTATLGMERKKLEDEKSRLEDVVSMKVDSQIKDERKKITESLKKRIEEEHSDRFVALTKELNDKSEQLKNYNKSMADLERLKREKEELREKIELESEKKLSSLLTKEKARIQKTEEEKSTMKLTEKEILINQLTEQLKDAQRKAEQGSSQLQGEAQEIVIEEWLAAQFPLDTIVEIKKGAQGADCLQIVNTRSRQNCGSVYYESKRAKNFQPSWIEKFKADIREKNADIGVLVTATMPSDMTRMGLRDGVWICSFEEFKGLSIALRESVIQISRAVATQENKGDKMDMLYNFLISNEFRLQIEAIVEGFTQMQSELESEKRAMQGIWKKREKQIEKVLLNTNHMYSSIKGIAGTAIQKVALLELGSEAETE